LVEKKIEKNGVGVKFTNSSHTAGPNIDGLWGKVRVHSMFIQITVSSNFPPSFGSMPRNISGSHLATGVLSAGWAKFPAIQSVENLVPANKAL